MGREIRRVPPNWQHPEHEVPDHRLGGFVKRPKPLHDESYGTVIAEWIENHLLWETGKHPDQQGEDRSQYRYYAQWGGDAPEVGKYRPDWKEGEATWWQVYETVSEGTPVTPAFATAEELIDYLVANGDY